MKENDNRRGRKEEEGDKRREHGYSILAEGGIEVVVKVSCISEGSPVSVMYTFNIYISSLPSPFTSSLVLALLSFLSLSSVSYGL